MKWLVPTDTFALGNFEKKRVEGNANGLLNSHRD